MAIDPVDFQSVTPTLVDKILFTQTANGDQPAVTDFDAVKTLVSVAPTDYFLTSGKISTVASAGNITLSVTLLDGNAPSSGSPLYFRIGDAIYSATSALSATLSAGMNWMWLGSSELAGRETDLFVYAKYNPTDGISIGCARFPTATKYSDFSNTSSNPKYAIFSNVSHASGSDPVVVIGRFNAALSAGAAYSWSIPGTSVIVNGPISDTRELIFLPTYSAETGTYSATQTATYQISGSVCRMNVQSDGTTSNATKYLYCTYPFVPSQTITAGCGVNDGDSVEAGVGFFQEGGDSFLVARYDSPTTDFGAGASRSIRLNITYFI